MRRALILKCSIVRTNTRERAGDSGVVFTRRQFNKSHLGGGEQSMKNLSRQRSVPTISTQVF